jgi:hypothetical protein
VEGRRDKEEIVNMQLATNPFLMKRADALTHVIVFMLVGISAPSKGLAQASGVGAFVGTNNSNKANGDWAVVVGGLSNTASTNFATVVGGYQNTNIGWMSTLGGGGLNLVSNLALCSTLCGGQKNVVLCQYSMLGGGIGNTVGERGYGIALTLGGGSGNKVFGWYGTLGGGMDNKIDGNYATLGGGQNNTISNSHSWGYATLVGGFNNKVSGNYAALGGGANNNASGNYSTVPGGARCKATNNGSFVWSGLETVDTVSVSDNSFTVRSPGGVRFITATNNSLKGVQIIKNSTAWTSVSDRESKTDFKPVDSREILSKLASMPVTSWQYKHDPSRRYIGPTSQDFMAAFHLGDYDKGINTLDADGVAFAAIQGLVSELKIRDKKIEALEKKMDIMQKNIESLSPPGKQ